MRLVWRAEARRNFREIIGYIAERNPIAAVALEDRVVRVTEQLPLTPFMFRVGRMPGTREAVIHPNYVIVYQVGNDFVRILTILHARQQYP